MQESKIKAEFITWWTDSYGRPPNPHALMTHVSFAAHLVKKIQDGSKGEVKNDQ
jgi:hypothetical protein